MFEDLGGEAKFLMICRIVFLCLWLFEAGPGGNKEKRFFYNHFDVQPEEPLDYGRLLLFN